MVDAVAQVVGLACFSDWLDVGSPSLLAAMTPSVLVPYRVLVADSVVVPTLLCHAPELVMTCAG